MSSWWSAPSGLVPALLELSDQAGFEVPALIWMLGANETPPSVLNEPQNWASSFGRPSVSPGPPAPRSLRASYQTTAMSPVVGSSAILGRNWLFAVASSFTRLGALQVAPLSSE